MNLWIWNVWVSVQISTTPLCRREVYTLKLIWNDPLWNDHPVWNDHFPVSENVYPPLDSMQTKPFWNDHQSLKTTFLGILGGCSRQDWLYWQNARIAYFNVDRMWKQGKTERPILCKNVTFGNAMVKWENHFWIFNCYHHLSIYNWT